MLTTSFRFPRYAFTAASAAVLRGDYGVVIAVCAVGALVGWPFVALAMLPLCLYTLAMRGASALGLAVAAAGLSLAPQLWVRDPHLVPPDLHLHVNSPTFLAFGLRAPGDWPSFFVGWQVDSAMYGQTRLGVLQLIQYNVMGGGADLYGTEGPLFYLKNLALNLNLGLPLALALPAAAAAARRVWPVRFPVALGCAVAPLWLWLGAMSIPAHKEERFMYCIYPTVCLAAACTLDALPWALAHLASQGHKLEMKRAGTRATKLVLAAVVLLSVSRTVALFEYYRAPMEVYKALPVHALAVTSTDHITVCVADDWFRFPSAFFLPSPRYRLRFLQTSFDGMLPGDFEASRGGTAWGSPALNDGNREATAFYARPSQCDFIVEQQRTAGHELLDAGSQVQAESGGVRGVWRVLAARPFLDAAATPFLTRVLYIPPLSQQRNVYVTYTLLQRLSH
jgi:alpha-1,2-mannosyltransferase